ncbi:MAG: hypothetical protein A4E20_09260 [Nitrospira sp. SG-bin2]|jgi:hypothetical protein|nr:MAG: hypothetical protein A4E20_09260 [Nitrospira sp. SG-bin2]
MLNDEPGVGCQEALGDSLSQQRFQIVHESVGGVGKYDIVRAFPLFRSVEKLFDSVRVHGNVMAYPAVQHILTQEFQRFNLGFNAGHMRGASAYGFDSDRSGPRIKIKYSARGKAIAKN